MSDQPLTAESPDSLLASEHEKRAVAVVVEGGPVVVEVEMTPLAIPSQFGRAPVTEAVAKVATGFWRRYGLFIVTVVLPMAIGSLYLFWIAAPRFSSESSFLVRSTLQHDADAISSAVSQNGAMLASEETYAVATYLSSRDVVDLLAKNNELHTMLNRPGADFLFRFPTLWLPNNDEFLYRRFQWMTDVEVDPTTQITTIEVNAFRPEDAQAMVHALLGYAEALINRLNERAYRDALFTADYFVARAQDDVDAVEAELREFRNRSGMVDPNLESQSKLKIVEDLSTELAQVEAAIAAQTTMAPSSPALEPLREKARSYRDEIQKRRLEIAGSAGSTATKLETYEQLTLRRDLAAKALAAAVRERDAARETAEQQHLYIQLITQPMSSPDYARYPRLGLDLAALIGLCLIVFQVMRKLREIAEQHQP